MKCRYCGAEIPPGGRFCPKCGKAAKPSRVCAKCGAELEEGVKFCTECGNPVGTASAGTAAPVKPAAGTEKSGAKRKSGMDIGGLIAGIAMLVIGVLNIHWMKSGDTYFTLGGLFPIHYLTIPLGVIITIMTFRDR